MGGFGVDAGSGSMRLGVRDQQGGGAEDREKEERQSLHGSSFEPLLEQEVEG